MPRVSTVQIYSDKDTKVVTGYAGPEAASGDAPNSGGPGTKPPKLEIEKVYNTKGSCAGAGSAEFDLYRLARNRERSRLEAIEENARSEAERIVFAAKVDRNKRIADERTDKNRAKRLKKKEKSEKRKATKQNSMEAGSESGDNSDCAPEPAASTVTVKESVIGSFNSIEGEASEVNST